MGLLARIFGRNKQNAQPIYTTVNAPPASAPEGIDLAPELPLILDFMAGGMPRWEDLTINLDPDAYAKMRVCVAIVKAVRKLAVRTSKLNWTIVGKGPRAKAAKEIFGQIKNWGDFIEWMTWALIEGVRFYQIKTAEARAGSAQPWKVPDFFMGGRLKEKAGGSIVWDGAKKLVQKLTVTGVAQQQIKELPIDQFAIHRPGGGSNPEGDTWLGAALYNSVGKAHPRGVTSGDLFMRLFGLPAIMVGAKVDKTRPDRISAMLEAKADKGLQTLDNQGKAKATAWSNEETIKLLQANAEGLGGIVEWLRYLESIADDLLAFGVLTSSSGIADANRTGNTEQHADEGDDAAFANGVQLAETFNRYVKPWIDSRNKALMPAPGARPDDARAGAAGDEPGEDGKPAVPFDESGETEEASEAEAAKPEMDWYLWPKNPEESDAQDVEVEAEGEDGAPMGEMPPMNEKTPADMAMLALRQIVQLQKKKTAQSGLPIAAR